MIVCVRVCMINVVCATLQMWHVWYLNNNLIAVLYSFISSFAAVSFAQQSYNVTEGGAVNVTLVTSTSDYEFDFNVTLQYMDGTATGEPCSVAYNVLHIVPHFKLIPC